MKTRARLISGLAALAALFLAPLVEASLTTSPAAGLAPAPAMSLTLTLAPEEPSAFSLGDLNLGVSLDAAHRISLFAGDELARAAHARAESFHPLAAVSLLLIDGAETPPVSAETSRFQETRIGVFDFLGSRIIGVERGVTLELRWGCERFGLKT